MSTLELDVTTSFKISVPFYLLVFANCSIFNYVIIVIFKVRKNCYQSQNIILIWSLKLSCHWRVITLDFCGIILQKCPLCFMPGLSIFVLRKQWKNIPILSFAIISRFFNCSLIVTINMLNLLFHFSWFFRVLEI